MGRIGKLKREIIAEANRKILNEEGPELSCNWFIMDTKYLDDKLGELHFTEQSRGIWYLQKFSNTSDMSDVTETTIEIPQYNDIEFQWDDNKKTIKLIGDSLSGLDAYNEVFLDNEDEYSCKLFTGANQSPSKFGVQKAQYIIAGKFELIEILDKPETGETEVEMGDGATITPLSYFVDKKLLKKRYYTLKFNSDKTFSNQLTKCNKYEED